MTTKDPLIYSERDVQEIINQHFVNRVFICVMVIACIPVAAFGGWILNAGNESMHIQKQLVEAQLELIDRMEGVHHPNTGEIQRLRQELIKRQGQQ